MDSSHTNPRPSDQPNNSPANIPGSGPDGPRLRSLFDHAMELPPSERAAYLDSACAGDAALRAQLDQLVAAAESDPTFLSAPTGDPTKTVGEATRERRISAVHERPGTKIGLYKLLQIIGEGGFGTVFLAEQDKPVRRRVALKILKLGMDTKSIIARFEAERQALALMDHPHIARVLDAGATESGRPFFVMEYVVGDAITRFADAHKLGVQDRLALFQQVCQAVQHAHTKGVIHRDLKPGNVLVSMSDGKPFAKVIDFGIAKATSQPLTDKTLFTEHRQLLGTPEYMSPEQAEGSADIDTRTDVYALGVLLYELLTGATPFDAKRLRSAAYAEMQRIIKEEEPPLPSVRLKRHLTTLAETAAARQLEPAKLNNLVKGELDWIVMKSLDKDRARRYESASQLAADVQRHLSGEPVLAAPPSTGYRVRTFVRRNRGAVIAGGAVAAALLVGMAGTTWQRIEAQTAARRAEALNSKMQSVVQRAFASLQYVTASASRTDASSSGTVAFGYPLESGKSIAVRFSADTPDVLEYRVYEAVANDPNLPVRPDEVWQKWRLGDTIPEERFDDAQALIQGLGKWAVQVDEQRRANALETAAANQRLEAANKSLSDQASVTLDAIKDLVNATFDVPVGGFREESAPLPSGGRLSVVRARDESGVSQVRIEKKPGAPADSGESSAPSQEPFSTSELSIALTQVVQSAVATYQQQTDAAEWSAYTANIALAQASMQAGDYPEARRRLAASPAAKRGWEYRFADRLATAVNRAFPGIAIFAKGDSAVVQWEKLRGQRLWIGQEFERQVELAGGPISYCFAAHVDAANQRLTGVVQILMESGRYELRVTRWSSVTGVVLSSFALSDDHRGDLLLSGDGLHVASPADPSDRRQGWNVWSTDKGTHVASGDGTDQDGWKTACERFGIEPSNDRRTLRAAVDRVRWSVDTPSFWTPDARWFHVEELPSANGLFYALHRAYPTVLGVFDSNGRQVSTTYLPDSEFPLISWSRQAAQLLVVADEREPSPMTWMIEPTAMQPVLPLSDKPLVSLVVENVLGRTNPGLLARSIATPDGTRRIVAGADKTIRFFEARDGKPTLPGTPESVDGVYREVAVFRVPQVVTDLKMTADGTRLILMHSDGSARIWDIRDPAERFKDREREWAEQPEADKYVDALLAGPRPTADLDAFLRADESLTPLRRLVAWRTLRDRLLDLERESSDRYNAAAKLAEERQIKDKPAFAQLLEAELAAAKDLSPRVAEKARALGEKWEYQEAKPTVAELERRSRLEEASRVSTLAEPDLEDDAPRDDIRRALALQIQELGPADAQVALTLSRFPLYAYKYGVTLKASDWPMAKKIADAVWARQSATDADKARVAAAAGAFAVDAGEFVEASRWFARLASVPSETRRQENIPAYLSVWMNVGFEWGGETDPDQIRRWAIGRYRDVLLSIRSGGNWPLSAKARPHQEELASWVTAIPAYRDELATEIAFLRFRLGQCREASEVLEHASDSPGKLAVTACIQWLIANQSPEAEHKCRTGSAEDHRHAAREALSRARGLLAVPHDANSGKPDWSKDVTVQLLIAEAANLIEGEAPKP